MDLLPLHDFHTRLNAHFSSLSDREFVLHYGEPNVEYEVLRHSVGLLDLSHRGRLCLTGKDRQNYLNGQVSNNIRMLRPLQGCYTAVLNVQGRMDGDCYVYSLPDEMLLDVESGLEESLAARLGKFIVSEDVAITNVTAPYGQLSIQGPKSREVLESLHLQVAIPQEPLSLIKLDSLSDTYLANHPRTGTEGFDLFLHGNDLEAWAVRLLDSIKSLGGQTCGWQALETHRIECGIPRYGADMNKDTLPTEAGITERAVSYKKGCYVGQEIMARLRVHGSVPAKRLCGLYLPQGVDANTLSGATLYQGEKEAGFITSAVASGYYKATLALGYVRAFANAEGSVLEAGPDRIPARVVGLPFKG